MINKLCLILTKIMSLICFMAIAPGVVASPVASPPIASYPSAQPERVAHFYVFGLGLGLGVGGAMSWKFHRTWTGEFERVHEGWFGRNTYAGGADKLGHFYTDFVLVRGFHHVYKAHGYSEQESIWNGFIASMITRTVMEVADGMTTFRFSMEDLIANMAGSASSALLLTAPDLDRVVGVSWSYMPSQEKMRGEVEPSSIDNDYNGSVYHLDFKLKGIRQLAGGGNHYRWMDRYNVGISYFTRGYDKLRPVKHRFVGLTIGANVDEALLQAGGQDWTYTRAVTRYFKLPFTFGGIYYDLDHHQVGVRYGLNYNY